MSAVAEIEDLSVVDLIEQVFTDIAVPGAMQRTGEYASGVFSENILGQHGPDGGAYPPLARPRSPSPPHNPGTRVLIDFGDLLASLSGGSDHIQEVGEAELTVGTKDPKAAIHQFGSPEKNIPARPFVGANDDIADYAANEVVDELIQKL